ncbi:MAG: type I restriction enzyme HsdR N-terminal domain-containing protein [Bacteroidales bacterium]|nr:type I restriction enzyme HsdR N-terminal domain-containing protein [Bacteroidales bacterium]
MDFKDSIKTIADRIDDIKDNLPTEEATKTALILPFIQALGYDIFNPNEVLPEMTCDIGTRRGERIDYAIFQDGEPIILMECKHWEQNLDLHETQLLRYFTVSTARFAILTNGIEYRFYTDTERPNIMDETPFLEINLLNLKDDKLESLRKFHKSYFNVSEILSSACELKYLNSLQDILEREFNNPSPDFVRVLCRQVEKTASFPQRVVERFTPIVKKSIQLYIRDLIFDRLTTLTTENQPITPPLQRTICVQTCRMRAA